ncbi:hypothetical protein MKEN_00754500 [Mycena kentingensis (nom. inval.)]|nr:hypothetical protein MKEN_00754500 [Mycena kentingensis (nom. inval.)]
MYDPTTTKRDELPTVHLHPAYVASATLFSVLTSTYLPYKISLDLPWQLALLTFTTKLFMYFLIACAPAMAPHKRTLTKTSQRFFFVVGDGVCTGMSLLLPTIPIDRRCIALVVVILCDAAALRLTTRYSRVFEIREHDDEESTVGGESE